jgi:hypothetical protein
MRVRKLVLLTLVSFPVLTMVSDGEIILEAGISPAFEGIWLRVNPMLVLQLGRLG